MSEFERLKAIMARLRSPGGCPWDAEQTHASLRTYLLEETYEVLEAIDTEDWERLAGELGDLLLQVVFHAQVAQESGLFDIEDVCRRISDKLEYRHPHVFGDVQVRDSGEVLTNWEQLKRQEEEHRERCSALDGVSAAQPALQQALELQRKAARVGFDWDDISGTVEKVAEELAELQAAESEREAAAELGDVLFALTNYARFRGIDPESALRETNQRFTRRFHEVERLASSLGRKLSEMTLAELDELWEQVKQQTG